MSSQVTLSQTSGHGPALTAFNNALVLAWAGKGNDYLNVASSSDGGQSWSSPTVISSQTTSATPAIAELSGVAYLAWAGTDSNHYLNLMQSSDLKSFSDQVTFQEKLAGGTGPALVVFNDSLYVAWTSPSAELMVAQISNGSLTSPALVGQTSSGSPALAADDSFLYIAWTGTNYSKGDSGSPFAGMAGTGGHEPGLNVMRSSDGAIFSGLVTLSETSPNGYQPALTESGGKLILGWTGSNWPNLNTMYSTDQGQSFTGKQTDTSNSSNWGPALCANMIAWTGTDNRLNVMQGV